MPDEQFQRIHINGPRTLSAKQMRRKNRHAIAKYWVSHTITPVLRFLAQEKQLTILLFLNGRDATLGEIHEATGFRRIRVFKDCQKLEAAGLIFSWRMGQRRACKLTPLGLNLAKLGEKCLEKFGKEKGASDGG